MGSELEEGRTLGNEAAYTTPKRLHSAPTSGHHSPQNDCRPVQQPDYPLLSIVAAAFSNPSHSESYGIRLCMNESSTRPSDGC